MRVLRILILALAAGCQSSCVSTFTDRSELEAKVEHRIEGNKINVTATITNRSDETITFVQHPDFWGISIFAVDRSKDETGGTISLISYERSTVEDLKRVPPGGEVHFTEEFVFRKKSGGIIEVEAYPQFENEPGYMRIWDDRLWVQFHYGKYPDYLPERAGLIGKNYVMVDIGAQEVFPQPWADQRERGDFGSLKTMTSPGSTWGFSPAPGFFPKSKISLPAR